jgi:ribose transport system permease protein
VSGHEAVVTEEPTPMPSADDQGPPPKRERDWVESAERYGLVGAFVIQIVIFSILVPHTFPTVQNWQGIAISQSVSAAIAFALMIPLVAGRFDISVGSNLGLAMIVAGEVMTKAHLPLSVAVVAALASSTLVGVVNGVVVAYFGVNSIIATLGSASILTGIVQLITGGVPIVSGLSPTLTGLGSDEVHGIPEIFIAMLIVAAVVWYAQTQTTWGRNTASVGSNFQAARLVGINVRRNILTIFIASGAMAGVAGLLEMANIGSADPSVGGIPLLLPALAAVFLGSTAFTPGHYNVPGTIVGIFFVAATISGLALIGTQVWAESVVEGGIVIIAVSTSQYIRRRRTNEPQVGA